MADMYAGVKYLRHPGMRSSRSFAPSKEVIGCEHDVLAIPRYGSMTQAEAEASVELFAREVIPRL